MTQSDNLEHALFRELTSTCPTTRDHSAVSDVYAGILEPFRDAPYPLDRAGTLLRVNKKFLGNWIDYKALVRSMAAHNPELAAQLQLTSTQRVMRAMEKTLYRIGTMSYTPEWQNPKTQEHLAVIDSAAEGVVIANKMLAAEVSAMIAHHFARGAKTYRLVDVGPGSGGTIVPIIENIDHLSKVGRAPPDYGRRLEIILIDIMPRSLELTQDRLRKRSVYKDQFTQPLSFVDTVQTNFADIEQDKMLSQATGKINGIISGGAIMHNTDVDPFFRTMYQLLSPGGTMNLWDWSSAYAWAAPALRVGSERGMVSPGLYQIKPEDVRSIRENLITGWMGPSGLFGYHGEKHAPLHKKLSNDFERGMQSTEGFNYIAWIRDNVAGKVPEPEEDAKTPYHFIEGYGPATVYTESMTDAGFIHVKDKSFPRVYARHAHLFNHKDVETIACQAALFFASGSKSR